MNIKETLAKLKALTASPNEHEADTAQKLYCKMMANHNLTEADLAPADLQFLASLGITITEWGGWTEAHLDTNHSNDEQVEATLTYLIRNSLKKRKQNEGKRMLLEAIKNSKADDKEPEGDKETNQ